MTKRQTLQKNIIFAFFATVILTITCLLASCGGTSEPSIVMFNVSWDVSEEATVSLEGYETLPTQVEENTTLVFTVDTTENYEVSRVIRNNKRVTPSSGKYTIKITEDTAIKVETGRIVTGIKVDKKPTKLTYYVGDALDITGMEVFVEYATGESEKIEKGSDGFAVSPSIFEGGETSFKVIYGNFETTVDLTSRVEYLVTIDPAGGTIVSKWINDLEVLGLANYNIDESGVITFTYFNNLPKTITLPVESQIIKEGFSFTGWSNTDNISNTSGTYSTTAQWQAELVVIDSVELVLENDYPYLIVEGQYMVANEVYLYLYEGNDKVSFTGDTYKNTSGENGAKFEVKFNLLRLAEATTVNGSSYEGKWMDIRFNAKLGEQEESMELFVGSGSKIAVNLEQKITSNGYTFLFAEYENMLKVYYNKIHYEYRAYFDDEATIIYVDSETGENKTKTIDALIFEGSAPLYKGSTILLTAWVDSEIELATAVIDATTGQFKIVIDVTMIPLASDCYVHITINNDKGEVVYGSIKTNLLIASCTNQTEMTELPKTIGSITNAIRHVDENGIATYCGYQWDGIILYRQDEKTSITYDQVSIEYKNETVYYVVSGECSGYTANDLTFEMDLQHNSNIDGVSWDYIFDTNESDIDFNVELAQDGTYKCYVPVSTIAGSLWNNTASNWTLTVHFGVTGSKNNLVPSSILNDYAVKDGIKYSLRKDDDTWNIASLVMEPTDETNGFVGIPRYTYDNATITNVNDRAIVTVSGKYYNVEASVVIANKYIDFQKNQYVLTYSWDGDWSFTYPEVVVTAENGIWTMTIDITDFTDNAYTCHGCVGATAENENGPDLKLPKAIDTSITIGTRTYRMVSTPGSDDDPVKFWGCLGFIISTNA